MANNQMVPVTSANHRRFEPCARRNSAPAFRIVSPSGFARVINVKEKAMLGWVLTFLVVALIAGVLGFTGIAGASIEIAKIIFFIAVVLFLISVIFGALRGRSPG
jgi:uncharacterized membrane protein YtjA (UPF0391 family)